VSARKVWVRAHEAFDEDPGFPASFGEVPQYVRIDLVKRLMRGHDAEQCCLMWRATEHKGCTCGYEKLERELFS
jgi:hypothetical protein